MKLMNDPDHKSMFDVLDEKMRSAYRLTQQQYEFALCRMSDDELEDFILGEHPTFAEKRKSLEIRDKYLSIFNHKHK